MTCAEYQRIVDELMKNEHRMFSITFKRRTDKWENGQLIARAGDLRTMVCRLHVHKGVQGKQPDRHDRDKANGLITVFEMAGDKSGFKCIPVDSIVSIGQAPSAA